MHKCFAADATPPSTFSKLVASPPLARSPPLPQRTAHCASRLYPSLGAYEQVIRYSGELPDARMARLTDQPPFGLLPRNR